MSETEAPTTTSSQPKKVKAKPENLVIPPPKPKLSKAERRALQEQQRAAKAVRQGGGGGDALAPQASVKKITNQPSQLSKQSALQQSASPSQTPGNTRDDGETQTGKTVTTPRSETRTTTSFVSHLASYRDPEQLFLRGACLLDDTKLHPAVIETGYQYATGRLRGGNARCRAMLRCFRILLADYHPASQENSGIASSSDYRHAMDQQVLKPSFQFWTERCRPHSVSMGNAFTFLKAAVSSLDRDLPIEKAKEILIETLVAYERERIDYAGTAIADTSCQKLFRDQGEVMLVYGDSEVISKILLLAAERQKKFRVIIVDSRPLLEGRKQLERLRKAGIQCTYILLNALTYVLQDVSKVLMGASALMSDGSIFGRVGTASVAIAATTYNIPVLICSETYKISNRVQMESITYNELGSPKALATHSLKDRNGTSEHLKILNLMYDLTPATFVSGIVTELGIVPPTSVAVLLREMNPLEFKGF